MTIRTSIVLLLAALIAAAAFAEIIQEESMRSTAGSRFTWVSFLYVIPALLSLLVFLRRRWALMGCVLYATIGLALDIATVVQGLTGAGTPSVTLMLSGVTGMLNFLLIMLGGWEFMHGASTPPGSRPPNPPRSSAW